MSVWGRLPPGESSSCQRPSLSSQEMLVASPGTTCSLAARSAARWASSWEGKVSEKTSPRVFRTKAISLDVVLASACLPRLHHAVNIHGEPHWDGGYAANPPIPANRAACGCFAGLGRVGGPPHPDRPCRVA